MLTGTQIEIFEEGLRDVFRHSELQRLVRIGLERDLEDITLGGNMVEQVSDLVHAALQGGWILQLVQEARAEREGRADFVQICNELELVLLEAESALGLAVFREVETLLAGIQTLPFDYDGEIEDLRQLYNTVFVGREEELQAVTAFAAREESGYMLVRGETGFGKAALSLQLVELHRNEQWKHEVKPDLVYFFIREKDGHNRSDLFLQALCSQLLALLGIRRGVPAERDALHLLFRRLWRTVVSQTRPEKPLLLLVNGLDKIDEDDDLSILDLLPDRLGKYVHVVVLSRSHPDPLLPIAPTHPLKQPETMTLSAFGKDEISVLLQSFRKSLGKRKLSADRRKDLAGRILKLTGGQPLFARFVCSDVAEDPARIDVFEAGNANDLNAYFQTQLDILIEEADDQTFFWDILGTLAVSLGGLRMDELGDLLDVPRPSRRRVRQALIPLRHLLIEQNGIDLVHAEVRNVIRNEFTGKELRAYEAKLIDWCKSYINRAGPVPAFALERYAKQLKAAGQNQALYDLISKDWMKRRWIGSGNRYSGFLVDVELALQVLKSQEEVPLVELVRLIAARQLIRARVAGYTDTDLQTLVYMNRIDEALSHVRLRMDLEQRIDGMLTIVRLQKDRAILDEAVQVAGTLHSPIDKTSALLKIADVMISLDRDGAIEHLHACRQEAAQIDHEDKRVKALRDTAGGFVRAGVFDTASEIAAALPEGKIRTESYTEIASLLAEQGEQEQALKVVDLIESVHPRSKALQKVAIALAKAGHIEAAREVFRELEHSDQSVWQLALALARSGDEEGVEQIAREIKNPDRVAELYGELAAHQARQGDADAAEASLYKAYDQIGEVTSSRENTQTTGYQYETFCNIADAFVQTRDLGLSRKVLRKALEAADKIDTDSVDQRNRALGRIAVMMAQSGDARRALDTVNQIRIIDTPRQTPAPDPRPTVLKDVAIELAGAGATRDAVRTAEEIGDLELKTEALRRIALMLARTGPAEHQRAHRALEAALDGTGILQGIPWWDRACLSLALALVRVDEVDRAETLVRRIKDPSAREKFEIEKTLTEVRNADLEEALDRIQSVTDRSGRDAVLTELLEERLHDGRIEEADRIVSGLKDDTRAGQARCKVAEAYIRIENDERALELLDELMLDIRLLTKSDLQKSYLYRVAVNRYALGIQRNDDELLESAGKILETAMERALEQEVESEQYEALTRIAAAWAELDEAETSDDILIQKMPTAYRPEAYRDQCRTYLSIGRKDEALASLNKALSLVQETDQLRHKSDIILKTGLESMAEAGVTERARDLLVRIEDKQYRRDLMPVLARAEAEAGRFVKAFETLADSETEPLRFLVELGTWIHLVEERYPDSVPDLIREIVAVFGWIRDDIRELFATMNG